MLILWLLLQLYLNWQGYSKHTKRVINGLLICTVYHLKPFFFHLRLTSVLMGIMRMTYWCAVLTSAASEIKPERPPPSKAGPASRLEQCRLQSDIRLPRSEKNSDINRQFQTRMLIRKVQIKKYKFVSTRTQKWVNVLDRTSRQRQLLIKKMKFITQRK